MTNEIELPIDAQRPLQTGDVFRVRATKEFHVLPIIFAGDPKDEADDVATLCIAELEKRGIIAQVLDRHGELHPDDTSIYLLTVDLIVVDIRPPQQQMLQASFQFAVLAVAAIIAATAILIATTKIDSVDQIVEDITGAADEIASTASSGAVIAVALAVVALVALYVWSKKNDG